MRILFVTHHYLDGFGGGTFASRGYINALARIADRVTLMCPVRGGAMPESIDPSVRIIPVEDHRGKMAKLTGLLAGKLHRYYDAFPQEVKESPYDLVIFDTCYPSFRMIDIAHSAGCKVVTIHHNFQLDFVRDNTVALLRPAMMYWTRRCEREAVLRSDRNLVLTNMDQTLLRGHYDPDSRTDIRVLGVFEYESRGWSHPTPHPDTPVFVITGDLGIQQTEQSIIPWADQYYPILRARVPDARVIVAGKNPTARIRRMCETLGFELIPSPPDMSSILSGGRYYICPTELGGGLKLRIMDGLKFGMPILAHRVSARGYESFEGICLFAYHDKESFQKGLEGLLNADVLPEDVIERYRSVFSFESGIKRMYRLLSDL